MSLTLPTAYSNASKQGNVQENWIVQLGFFNGDAEGKGDGGWDAVLQSGGAANLLTADVNDSTTTIPVDDGTVFAANDFLKIESEIVKVVSISSNDLTVVRTQMGTSAEAHEDDDAIYWNNFTPISLSDTTVDSVFYHGVITNRPSIRSSISLSDSTAKTGNITLSLVNFKYKGDDFSAELLGTRKYINREVRIFSQLNGNSSLSNCLQVYQGRLVDLSHDDSSINLSITEQRPWDFITIPNEKSNRNDYVPVAYGDFTGNSEDTVQSNKTLFPIPKTHLASERVAHFITPKTYGSGATPHYYDKNNDIFIVMSGDSDASTSSEGKQAMAVDTILQRGTYYIYPTTLNDSNQFTNAANAIDGNTGTSSYADVDASRSGTGTAEEAKLFTVNMPNVNGVFSEIKLHVAGNVRMDRESALVNGTLGLYDVTFGSRTTIAELTSVDVTTMSGAGAGSAYTEVDLMSAYENLTASGSTLNGSLNDSDSLFLETGSGTFTQGDIIKIDNELMKVLVFSGVTLYVERGYSFSSAASHSSGATINKIGDGSYNMPSQITLEAKVEMTSSSTGTTYCDGRVTITDMYLKLTVQNDFDREPIASNKYLEDLEHLYLGADGLTESWSGSSAAIQYGHEAHRDLLIRFAGYTTTDPENWSALNTDRSLATWKIRWWELEPIELQKVLEKLQYEFGFIFKFRPDGTGSYVHIKQTSELSAAQTLTKADIDKLKISNVSFGDLLTKMEISYEKHPSENRYLSSVTSSNSTARTNWNVRDEENVKDVKLDMNVGTPNTSGQSDPNTDFYSYYDNIFGDIKKIVSCDIVNPAVSYNLESGDIIQFSNTAGDMPIEPFGDNWADYYMITNLNRSPGKVGITCREVG